MTVADYQKNLLEALETIASNFEYDPWQTDNSPVKEIGVQLGNIAEQLEQLNYNIEKFLEKSSLR